MVLSRNQTKHEKDLIQLLVYDIKGVLKHVLPSTFFFLNKVIIVNLLKY